MRRIYGFVRFILKFWKKKKNLQDKENLKFSAMHILDTEQCMGRIFGHNQSRSQSCQVQPVTCRHLSVFFNRFEVYSLMFSKLVSNLDLQPSYFSKWTGSSVTSSRFPLFIDMEHTKIVFSLFLCICLIS